MYPYVRKCHAHKHYQNKSESITDNYCGKFEGRVESTTGTFGFHDICPNSTNNETDCKENQFFCKQSKSCIDQAKKCNGIINCVEGEDEDFDLCQESSKSIFPETATISCKEINRTGSYNIGILATPCNGVKECRDGRDENCDQDWRILSAFIGITFAGIVAICSYLHFRTTKRYPTIVSDDPENIDEETAEARSNFRGNVLAKIKVITDLGLNILWYQFLFM